MKAFKGYKYLQPEYYEFKDSIQMTMNLNSCMVGPIFKS